MKKPFYKRWWFIIICVFVVLGVIFSPDGDNGNGEQETNAPTFSTSIATEPETAHSLPDEQSTPEVINEPETTAPETETPTGESSEPSGGGNSTETKPEKHYVLNTSSKKVHESYCTYVEKIKSGNYATIDSLEKALEKGYDPCKKCNPR